MKVEEIKLAFETNVKLSTLSDIETLYEKGLGILSKADSQKSILRGLYSDALIILDQNVIGQANKAIAIANELGAKEVADKLTKLRDDSKQKAKDNMTIYNALK